MKKQYFNIKPKPVEHVCSAGIITTIIRFDIEKAPKELGKYQCEEVEYNHKSPIAEDDYGPIVTAIIRGKYSADDIEALTLNYTADQEKYAEEMDRLQAWRTTAKERAREIVKAS